MVQIVRSRYGMRVTRMIYMSRFTRQSTIRMFSSFVLIALLAAACAAPAATPTPAPSPSPSPSPSPTPAPGLITATLLEQLLHDQVPAVSLAVTTSDDAGTVLNVALTQSEASVLVPPVSLLIAATAAFCAALPADRAPQVLIITETDAYNKGVFRFSGAIAGLRAWFAPQESLGGTDLSKALTNGNEAAANAALTTLVANGLSASGSLLALYDTLQYANNTDLANATTLGQALTGAFPGMHANAFVYHQNSKSLALFTLVPLPTPSAAPSASPLDSRYVDLWIWTNGAPNLRVDEVGVSIGSAATRWWSMTDIDAFLSAGCYTAQCLVTLEAKATSTP